MKNEKRSNMQTASFGKKGKTTRRIGLFIGVLIIVAILSGLASADVFVNGHFRSNGTYVQPHYRSNPDGNSYNNWSTSPNVNPYTGRTGTRRLW